MNREAVFGISAPLVAIVMVYVSERSGSLEELDIARGGAPKTPAALVAGVPAGATDTHPSTIPVASGRDVVQIVPPKAVAACWAAHPDGEVCIPEPGSMTVSCDPFGPGGFQRDTSDAVTAPINDFETGFAQD